MLGARHEADDVVQDALVSAFSGRARFASVAEAEAYVRRAIASRSIDRGRKRTRETQVVARALSMRPGPVEDDVVLPGFAAEVRVALAGLSPQVRACVVLRHVEDLS